MSAFVNVCDTAVTKKTKYKRSTLIDRNIFRRQVLKGKLGSAIFSKGIYSTND